MESTIFRGKIQCNDSNAGYREITGSAPLYDKWAYGFWQCKEHYHNQTELLNAAAKFRALKIPVDALGKIGIIGNLGWGPHWDPKLYPNPKEIPNTIQCEIHIYGHVWSRFDKNTFYKEMLRKDTY